MPTSNTLLQPPLPSLPLLPPSHLNLMPFHLNYSGPAEVSTYFMPRSVSNPSFVSNEETPGVEEKIAVAAFRGRRLQAREIQVPEGYTGLVLSAPPSSSLHKLKAEITQELKVKTRVTEVAESGPRRSPRKRKAEEEVRRPKKREMKKFSMDTDSEEEEALVEEEPAEEESSLAAVSTHILTATSTSISLDLEPLSPFLDPAPNLHQQQQQETRTLTPTAIFEAFTLWHPDGPVDAGRDEYCRALGEWMRLGEILHAD